jgi:branched-chain amino acid transport system permease protein
MVVLGGTGSITGSAIAAALLFYLPEKLRDLPPVSGSSLVAAVLAIVAAVVVIKKLEEGYHGPKLKRGGFMALAVIGAVLLQVVLAMLLKNVPQLASAQYEASKLRMVIFAGTLIILMLIRPQGVFAHHEFSWSWIQRLFGRKAPTKEVAV